MKYTFTSLLFVLASLWSPTGYASDNPDSLLVLVKAKSGTEKAVLLLKLAAFYKNSEPQKALDNAKLALTLYEELNFTKGKADSYANLGKIYINLSNSEAALQSHRKALELRTAMGNKLEIAKSLNDIGEAMEHLGNYDQAIEHFFKAIKLEEEISAFKELSASYSLLSTIYYVLREFPKALEFSNKALAIREKINDQEGIGNSLELLGLINYGISNYDLALEYYAKTLKIRESMNDKIGISGMYQNLGLTYKVLLKFDLALYYFNKVKQLSEQLGNKRGVASALISMGQTYEKQGKDKLALENFLKSYQIMQQIKDKRGMSWALRWLGNIYEKLGDYKKALSYRTLFYSYRDSLNNAKSIEKVTALNLQYKSERKDKEIALLQKENVIQKSQRNSLIAGCLFITIIALIIYAAYRSKRKTNLLLNEKNLEITSHHRELERLNSELRISNATKDKFFSILAHDLRSPFFGLLGMSEELARDSAKMEKEEIEQYAGIVHESAKKIFELLNNLLDWSALKSGRNNPELEKLDLHAQAENIKHLFEPTALGKSIIIHNEVQSEVYAFADRNMVGTVLRNLLSNAIKFSFEDSQIVISSKQCGEFTELSISDHGIGMKADRLERIFGIDTVLSTKGTLGETGSGLGLVLCKELVEKNGGIISVSSTPGEGTVFSFTLPAYKVMETEEPSM